ncbi:NADH-quinone oxidoreductase subunit N [Arthrobacter sp. VKM Ac-2550]|uniref:NADH-quinone oxidoreductase subunit N n=1 Tax=Crystallibacter permensis TaxID=1938888 RepID=UPI002227D4C6|nr:NADH-quinone oxidoreductase subunit N [Arthrobacter sp. VKM Ac-2550]MCW2134133.1 NADH dehydrogenase subunit N [Arthrobacter sp. VKM Ac-2550]
MEASMRMLPALLLPEIIVFIGALAVLLGGSFMPRRRQWIARIMAALALLGATAAAIFAMVEPAQTAFSGTFAVDTATGMARIVTAVATLLVLGVASGEIAASPRESDTYALLLFAATGVMVLAGATDLLVLIAGFLLASIPLYGIVGLAGGWSGAEAALKTYLMGALSGILLMLGVTVLYALAGGTDYALLGETLPDAPNAAVGAGVLGVLAGLLFKAGGVPFHFWVPDASQGTGGAAATFLTTVPKVGALVAVYRLVDTVSTGEDTLLFVAAILATASMFLGNLAAYWQTDPRRLLGWSTVAQVGFLLVPVAAAGRSGLALPSLLFYLAAYAVTNVAAFAVTAALPQHRELVAYRGLVRARPGLALALLVALLGLVGTPPLAVFVGKLTTATAAWDGGHGWLALAVMLNSLLSLFYYLRWFAPVFAHPRQGAMGFPKPGGAAAWPGATAGIAAAASLALGLLAGPLWAALEGPLAM